MSKIRNIKDLRDYALETLENLKADKINIQHAATVSAMCASVISTVKTQLDYFKAIDERPQIEFMNAPPIYDIEQSKMKQIGHKNEKD